MTMFWVSPPRFASCMPFRSTATRISARNTPSIEPAAPEDVDAAEDDGGDDVEQRALCGVGARGAEEAHVGDPGDSGHEARRSRRS